MRRTSILVIVTLAVAIGTPRTAEAQWGFFEWLSSLDPGQAHVFNEHVDFACAGGPRTIDDLKTAAGVLVFAPRQTDLSTTATLRGKTLSGCSNPESARVLIGVDLNLGIAAVKNTSPTAHIGLTAPVGTIAWNLGGAYEVGGGLGAARFWQGSSSTDPGFGMWSPVAAINFGVRPGVIYRAHKKEAGAATRSAARSIIGNMQFRASLYFIWNGSERANPAGGPAFKSFDIEPMLSLRIGFFSILGRKF